MAEDNYSLGYEDGQAALQEQLTTQEIDDVVCDIMRWDGPDRHVDGHEVLTQFILALLGGDGGEWAESYRFRKTSGKPDPTR